jgi:hypothetical protein
MAHLIGRSAREYCTIFFDQYVLFLENIRPGRHQTRKNRLIPACPSLVAVLHCHDDPDREARARLFYEANLEAMNA